MKILFIIILFAANAFATDYYVTQSGAGDTDGTSLDNAWSVANFNSTGNWDSSENADKIDPGDTVYFSGSITSQVLPAGSGTSGNYITIDGYEAGDCDPLNAECTSSAVLSDGLRVNLGYDYLKIQDLRMTVDKMEIWTNSGSDISEYIEIRRNYLYAMAGSMFSTAAGSAPTGPAHLIVDGNKFLNFGASIDAAQGFNLVQVSDVVVSNNVFGHSASDVTTSANWIEVHVCTLILFEYNEIYGAPEQAGIAIKENGSQDIIVRYNKIYDGSTSAGGRAIGINWPLTERIYVYGNYMYECGKYAMDIFDGAHDIFIWSNIMESSTRVGVITWWVSGRAPADPHVDDLYLYNNVVYNNASEASGSADISWNGFSFTDSGATDIIVKNNIFHSNRANASTYHQMYVPSGLSGDVTLEHNHYYFPSQTPTVYYLDSYDDIDTLQAGGLEDDAPTGTVSDPLFSDVDNDDFYLSSGSPGIDSGATLSDSVLPDYAGRITINGETYCNNDGGTCDERLSFDLALDPDNTDWSTIPPTVTMVDQDSHGDGWERGAYAYIVDSTTATAVTLGTGVTTTVNAGQTATIR